MKDMRIRKHVTIKIVLNTFFMFFFFFLLVSGSEAGTCGH